MPDGEHVSTSVALVMHSADGIRWERTSTRAASHWLKAIVWGNGRAAAIGDHRAILHSSDGIRWHKANGIDTWDLLTDVAWGGEWFIAVSDHGLILQSRDRVHWEEVATASPGTRCMPLPGEKGVSLRSVGTGRFWPAPRPGR